MRVPSFYTIGFTSESYTELSYMKLKALKLAHWYIAKKINI